MRKRSKKPLSEEEEFTYRRENMFDFEAWYRAHFNNDFETKLRGERVKKFEQQYREQMERIARGHGIRPPRRFVEPKYPSDIEIQMEEMERAEIRKQIVNVLMLGMTLMVAMILVVFILERDAMQNGPYVDPYVRQKEKESPETEKNE